MDNTLELISLQNIEKLKSENLKENGNENLEIYNFIKIKWKCTYAWNIKIT